MLGLQDYIINNKIKVTELAKKINIHPTCIYEWFRNGRISKRSLPVLVDKLGLAPEYLTSRLMILIHIYQEIKNYLMITK
jgi:hypothetical protein